MGSLELHNSGTIKIKILNVRAELSRLFYYCVTLERAWLSTRWVCPSFFHYHQYRTITTRLNRINELIIKITSSSKLTIYELVPTLVTLKFEIGQPLGCQGGNFLVATAKSEDGFRKAQQLTEEATETPPYAVGRGMSLCLGASAQHKGAAAERFLTGVGKGAQVTTVATNFE